MQYKQSKSIFLADFCIGELIMHYHMYCKVLHAGSYVVDLLDQITYNYTQFLCVCLSAYFHRDGRSHASEIWGVGVTWSWEEQVYVCLVI